MPARLHACTDQCLLGGCIDAMSLLSEAEGTLRGSSISALLAKVTTRRLQKEK